MTLDPNNTTIAEAKSWLRPRAHTTRGEHCPLCNQLVKIYRRKLSKGMAHALILIYRHFDAVQDYYGNDHWLDVNKFLLEEGINSAVSNFALLRHWGLIERKPGQKEDRNPCLGLYRITDLGRRFVRGECQVPKYVYLYNGKLFTPEQLKLCPEQVEMLAIRDALGERFNYEELMRGL